MNLINNEFYAVISGISALSELTGIQFGQPSLVIADGNGISSVGDISKVTEFFRNAPFMTALAADAPDNEISRFFDMVIPAGNVDEYAQKLFKDKTPKQAAEITACFTAARNNSAEKVLECESKAFYRLMAEKLKEETPDE
ncbi:MAG: hypothetical protein MJ100_06795 [Ruminococcus sp.]|nr:hypothetical protein [Ruminococcus sp.]